MSRDEKTTLEGRAFGILFTKMNLSDMDHLTWVGKTTRTHRFKFHGMTILIPKKQLNKLLK